MIGNIYKIVCGNHFYYGSTTQTLPNRKKCHTYRIKNGGNRHSSSKLYNHLRDKEWTMELVESIECNDSKELKKREDEIILQYINNEFCLNSYNSQLNKEKDKQRKKDWYKANREHCIELAKENYFKKHEENKKKRRIYYEKNKLLEG